MSALDEKTKAERALKDLQKVQGEEQVLFGGWLANSFPFYYFFFFFFNSISQFIASENSLSFGFIC